MNAAKTSVDGNNSSVIAIKVSVNGAETDVDGAKGSVDAAEGDVNASESDVNAAETNVDGSKCSVIAIKADANGAEGSVIASERDVNGFLGGAEPPSAPFSSSLFPQNREKRVRQIAQKGGASAPGGAGALCIDAFQKKSADTRQGPSRHFASTGVTKVDTQARYSAPRMKTRSVCDW